MRSGCLLIRMSRNMRITRHLSGTCLNRAGYQAPLEQWRCTMAHGLYCGYTAGLDATEKPSAFPGQVEAGCRKGTDPVFLCPLQANKDQREPYLEPAVACKREVGAFQGI